MVLPHFAAGCLDIKGSRKARRQTEPFQLCRVDVSSIIPRKLVSVSPCQRLEPKLVGVPAERNHAEMQDRVDTQWFLFMDISCAGWCIGKV